MYKYVFVLAFLILFFNISIFIIRSVELSFNDSRKLDFACLGSAKITYHMFITFIIIHLQMANHTSELNCGNTSMSLLGCLMFLYRWYQLEQSLWMLQTDQQIFCLFMRACQCCRRGGGGIRGSLPWAPRVKGPLVWKVPQCEGAPKQCWEL